MVQLRVNNHYSDLGVLTGVLIDDNKRRRILKDMGLEQNVSSLAQGMKFSNQDEVESQFQQPKVNKSVARAI